MGGFKMFFFQIDQHTWDFISGEFADQLKKIF
jgi:hypothetical protein